MLIRFVCRVLFLVSLVCVIPVLALAAGLVAVAIDYGSNFFAWACIAICFGVPILFSAGSSTRPRAGLIFGGLLIAAGAAAWGMSWAMAPSPPLANDELASVFPSGELPPRSSPAWIVSEVDQFALGSLIVPMLDPFIDQEQAGEIRGYFSEVYIEGRRRAAFQEAGSTMPWAYAELFNRPFAFEHYYRQVPDQPDPSGKWPVVLFLHGSGGNFKGYQPVWRRWANPAGYAVLSPSFGFGNWNRADAAPFFDKMLEWIKNDPQLDENRIILAGLSNGGIGVTRMATLHPKRFEQVWYLSPVMETSLVMHLADGWKEQGTPVRVLYGGKDRRIPADIISTNCEMLKKAGVDVTGTVVPSADHFLFFSHREAFEGFASAATR